MFTDNQGFTLTIKPSQIQICVIQISWHHIDPDLRGFTIINKIDWLDRTGFSVIAGQAR